MKRGKGPQVRDKASAQRLARAHLGTDKQCTQIKKNGNQCRRPALKGLTKCQVHGGPLQKYNREKREQKEKIRAILGVPLEVDPAQALLGQVHEAAGNVALYRSLIESLEPTPIQQIGLGEDGFLKFHQQGIYGWDHLGDGATHILVKMYDAERERLTKFAKMAIDAGIAERQVRLAERQGEMIAKLIGAIIDDERLALSDTKRELARKVAGEHLRMLPAAGETS